MGIALVVGTVRAGLPVDATTGSELPEDLLVQGVPEEPGPHEGLVVEAGGQEPSDQLVDGGEVPTQARPDVLGADGHAVGQPAAAGADVGLVSDLHEQVRIPVVGGQDSAPPVVLHAAGEHLDTRCCQRRGDRVALVACETATVPSECQRRGPVDDLTGTGWYAQTGQEASESRISLVTVFRSMVK